MRYAARVLLKSPGFTLVAVVTLALGIGAKLWLKHFGGDPSAVGRSVTLDGQTYAIIGVAPAGFEYPDKTAVWTPPFQLVPTLGPQMDIERTRGFGFLSAVGLLKQGASVRQAKTRPITSASAQIRRRKKPRQICACRGFLVIRRYVPFRVAQALAECHRPATGTRTATSA